MQDQYGNYVVQYCIDRAGNEFLSELTDRAGGRVANLFKSLARMSSKNVCIALIVDCACLITEITTPATMTQMLYDQYANYVVQRALSVADQEQARLI